MAARVTSGPMPSPARTAIFFFTVVIPGDPCDFVSSTRGGVRFGGGAAAAHLVNNGQQIAIGYLLIGVGTGGGAGVALGQFGVRGLVAEFVEARTQGAAPGMLAEDERASRDSHLFRHDDFVGERIFQNAVLVNAGFV